MKCLGNSRSSNPLTSLCILMSHILSHMEFVLFRKIVTRAVCCGEFKRCPINKSQKPRLDTAYDARLTSFLSFILLHSDTEKIGFAG